MTDEQRQLVSDNHNLIYGFASKRNLDLDEWYGQLAVELCNAVLHWNSKRGSLSTYYYMRAESMLLLDYQNRNYHKRKANEDTSDVNLEILHDDGNNVDEKRILEEIKEYGNHEIITMRYEGYSQDEIADKFGVTQPTISRILDRILERYREGCESDYQ